MLSARKRNEKGCDEKVAKVFFKSKSLWRDTGIKNECICSYLLQWMRQITNSV